MAKEAYVQAIRDKLAQNAGFEWEMMQKAGRLFEKLCVPENAMPDDEVMHGDEMTTTSAMWAYIRSTMGQAESQTTHHDYADAIAVSLIATANVLTDYPPEHASVKEFESLAHLTPQQFLELAV